MGRLESTDPCISIPILTMRVSRQRVGGFFEELAKNGAPVADGKPSSLDILGFGRRAACAKWEARERLVGLPGLCWKKWEDCLQVMMRVKAGAGLVKIIAWCKGHDGRPARYSNVDRGGERQHVDDDRDLHVGRASLEQP